MDAWIELGGGDDDRPTEVLSEQPVQELREQEAAAGAVRRGLADAVADVGEAARRAQRAVAGSFPRALLEDTTSEPTLPALAPQPPPIVADEVEAFLRRLTTMQRVLRDRGSDHVAATLARFVQIVADIVAVRLPAVHKDYVSRIRQHALAATSQLRRVAQEYAKVAREATARAARARQQVSARATRDGAAIAAARAALAEARTAASRLVSTLARDVAVLVSEGGHGGHAGALHDAAVVLQSRLSSYQTACAADEDPMTVAREAELLVLDFGALLTAWHPRAGPASSARRPSAKLARLLSHIKDERAREVLVAMPASVASRRLEDLRERVHRDADAASDERVRVMIDILTTLIQESGSVGGAAGPRVDMDRLVGRWQARRVELEERLRAVHETADALLNAQHAEREPTRVATEQVRTALRAAIRDVCLRARSESRQAIATWRQATMRVHDETSARIVGQVDAAREATAEASSVLGTVLATMTGSLLEDAMALGDGDDLVPGGVDGDVLGAASSDEGLLVRPTVNPAAMQARREAVPSASDDALAAAVDRARRLVHAVLRALASRARHMLAAHAALATATHRDVAEHLLPDERALLVALSNTGVDVAKLAVEDSTSASG